MTARVGGSSDVGKVSITVSVTAKVGGCRGGVGKVSITVGVTARVGGYRGGVGKVSVMWV